MPVGGVPARERPFPTDRCRSVARRPRGGSEARGGGGEGGEPQGVEIRLRNEGGGGFEAVFRLLIWLVAEGAWWQGSKWRFSRGWVCFVGEG